jgi:RHS repeat-associated protein
MLWQNIFISIILEIESGMREGDMRRSLAAKTIAENLPPGQISYEWQAGKILNGWASPGVDFKVRVSSLESSSSAGASYYIYDSGGKLLAEYDGIGACVKDYLYLGGKMVGEFVPSSGSYYYYASDQINSTRLVTDSTGAVVHSAQYDPYGGLYKIWVDTYHPKPGFSGKEREFGSEMDYFGARYYGHKQYRFLSVDPVINKNKVLVNPQFWNLYTYCDNNPINFIDQDGKDNGSLAEYRVREEWKKSYGETRADQFNRGVNHVYFVGGVIGGLIIGGAVLTVAVEIIIPATFGAEQIAVKFGDKIERGLNRTFNMDIMEKTLDLLDLFSSGKGKNAVKIIETMANSGEGRSALLKIHQQVSKQLLDPGLDVISVNAMKSLQQITGFFSRGGN